MEDAICFRYLAVCYNIGLSNIHDKYRRTVKNFFLELDFTWVNRLQFPSNPALKGTNTANISLKVDVPAMPSTSPKSFFLNGYLGLK